MSKFNKSKHIDKHLFYENDYYEDTDESYKIIILSKFEDKLVYIKQIVSIFLKCFPLMRPYTKNSIFYNPKQDIESTFLDSNNKIYILLEENSNQLISLFMLTKIDNKYLISNACTKPLENRKGFMKLLMKSFLDKFNYTIELEVFEENPARFLYESLGFQFVKYIDTKSNEMDFWEDGLYSKKCLYKYKNIN